MFSNKLSEDEKSRIAAKLLTISVPSEFSVGKPEFPDILEKTELADFLGPNSWFLFNKLKISSEWLSKSITSWSEDSNYCVMEEFVRTVKTKNDTAERGVKLMTDYANILTKDEGMKQWILQAVDDNRKKYLYTGISSGEWKLTTNMLWRT